MEGGEFENISLNMLSLFVIMDKRSGLIRHRARSIPNLRLILETYLTFVLGL